MKFTVVRSKFIDALQTAQNVVPAKHTIQILMNCFIKAEEGKLTIISTDMDMSVKCVIDCEVETPGSTTLPIKRLVNIVRELSEGRITFDIDDNDVVKVKSGSSFFKINGLSPRDFPPIPATEGTFCYRIDQKDFRTMLRQTYYAASTDETRRVLTGLLMAFKDSKLTMVATDGRRLALIENEVEFPAEAEKEVILPTKAVQELMRTLGDEGVLKIYTQKTQIIFEIGSTTISTKLIEGVYPNYRQVVPGGCDERVTIEREQLLAALRRVSQIATDKSQATKLTFSANQLTIVTLDPTTGEARETMPVKYTGKEITVAFNPEYVMDPLKNLTDDEIYFEMSNGHSPVLVKCSLQFLYVLMPLRIN